MDRNKVVTGQIIFRDTNKKAFDLDRSNRKLVSFVGIIAIPEHFPIKGEHQYNVIGVDTISGLELTTLVNTKKDISEITRGLGLGQLIREPIWRV